MPFLSAVQLADANHLRPENVFVYDITDSTNVRAKEFYLSGKHSKGSALFVAERQSAGKGTKGRSFYSESDTGLYFSLLVSEDNIKFNAQAALTPTVAVAIILALRNLYDERADGIFIKWVNDIFFENKKLGGILCQRVVSAAAPPAYIIGIGLNLYGTSFREEIRDIAISLEAATGKRVEKAKILSSIIDNIFNLIKLENTENVIALYRSFMMPTGIRVKITGADKDRAATFLGIDEDFRLLAKYDNGTCEALVSADVSIKFD